MSRLSALLLCLLLAAAVLLAVAWTERAAIGRAAGLAIALRLVWLRLCRQGVKDV
jgi:hypothetical protein